MDLLYKQNSFSTTNIGLAQMFQAAKSITYRHYEQICMY